MWGYYQGPFINEHLFNPSQMTQVDLKVFKRVVAAGPCELEGNEVWEVMESDSRQIADARSSPSGETREDR